MVGIDEVARRAGVSAATVSRALSGNGPVSAEARARVESAAHELHYVVSSNASSLASGRTRNVGVVVPHLNRWFFSSVVEGAERALLRHGYDLTLYNLSGGGEERRSVFDHFLRRRRVDAVIAVALELTDAEISGLLALDKPLVGVGGPLAGVPSLEIDEMAIARLATEHLLMLGHSSIFHIGGSAENDTDFHIGSHRRAGFEQAMAAASLPVSAESMIPADFTIAGGYARAKQVLGHPHHRPTAIFAACDEIAIGAILAARDLGLAIPRDVSIVGIDDHELADFFQLTTVAQFPTGQGELAAEILIAGLDPARSQEPSLRVPLPFELIVRSSTAAPRD
ncbi:LacI family DNA-binding transcriptional regulator [Lacisediminihabitans sp. FW035]